MKLRRPVLALAVALALTGVTSCGSSGTAGTGTAGAGTSSAARSASGSPSAGAPATSTAAHIITIKDFGYQGPEAVAPGSTIMIKNDDAQAHTVTADDGHSFDVVVPGGGTALLTAPQSAGSCAYHCTYHPNMHATLVLK